MTTVKLLTEHRPTQANDVCGFNATFLEDCSKRMSQFCLANTDAKHAVYTAMKTIDMDLSGAELMGSDLRASPLDFRKLNAISNF